MYASIRTLSRMTRLGEISPFGQLFAWVFFENCVFNNPKKKKNRLGFLYLCKSLCQSKFMEKN
jgi:hypothetical protein